MDTNQFYFEKDVKFLRQLYPDLRHTPTKDNFFQLKGDVPIFDANGHLRGIFNISIRYASNYPKGFAKLYEIGNDIPNSPDWHKYDDDECCVCATPEELIEQKKKNNALFFLEKYAIPFLVNYVYKKDYNIYPNGEYGHGSVGTIEWYQEKFPKLLLPEIQKILLLVSIDKGLPKPYEKCICNSDKKLRVCHYKIIQELKLLSFNVLFEHIKLLSLFYLKCSTINRRLIGGKPSN